ncbi:hypothetical protein [Bifidobacterium adolescentis]|uniref:hypothetical protein n=1 Tax=Bifidobacterium adolescentis TaxID=1680 RepID=UPI00406339AC
MTERPLIAIDLDNTFADYTTASKDCLTQMGYDGYADAPDPSDYSFACSGWFKDENMFLPLHRRAVGLGLYLRERPYAGALDAAYDVARRHSVLFATSREPDETDGLRWLHAYGLDATPNWNLDLWRDTYPETFEWTIRDSCRRDGSGIRFCHIWDKTFLDADLTVEDNPHTLNRLMDKGLRVLVKRHAYNLPQCERAEQSGLGFAFDDWTQVPTLAKRLLGENAK